MQQMFVQAKVVKEGEELAVFCAEDFLSSQVSHIRFVLWSPGRTGLEFK